MRRIALLSIVPIALIAGVVGVRAVGTRCASTTSADAGSCEMPKHANASSHENDAVMSMVCQRSCAVKDYDPASLVAQPDVAPGDLTRCPVSGVVFTVTEGSPDVVHHGAHYRLCCEGCEKKFRSDPARFVG